MKPEMSVKLCEWFWKFSFLAGEHISFITASYLEIYMANNV
jgi:hypothetical protein